MEKAQSSRIVPKIRHLETNQIETDPRKISDAFAKYYEHLHRPQDQESKKEKNLDFLKPLKMNKLINDEESKLVENIREDEIKETIIRLMNNKSPGVDVTTSSWDT